MDDLFDGAGAPPIPSPRKQKGNWPEFGFEEPVTATKQDGEVFTVNRRIITWRLKPGESNRPIVLLDYLPDGKVRKRRSVYLFTFTGRDNRFGSQLVSIWKDDPAGDPMVDALGKEPQWVWALSGIDLTPYVSEKTGKTYYSRCLVLITDKQKDVFLTAEKMGGGLRGHVFNVSRSKDQKSFKIGDKWEPVEKMTDEQMQVKFAEAAVNHGMPIEDFIEPVDYEAIFEPKSREELAQIAKDLRAMASAREGVQVAGEEDGDQEIKF
jgi:hypothetical protein